MIKRLVHPDDHLQEAGPSSWLLFVLGCCLSLVGVCRWSVFVIGRCFMLVVVCRWPLFVVGRCLSLEDHLQEAGRSR